MVIQAFPPLEDADENGLLAIGGDLEVESLLLAYANGIFPWPIAGADVIPWFSPPERALLFFSELHIPKSLFKEQRRQRYAITFDCDFPAVIAACRASRTRKRWGETWITEELECAYIELHRAGFAHSVECYDGTELIGGMYGVSIGGMFAGESMFYYKPNTSKLCLLALIEHLQRQGVNWLDCQQLTPLVSQLGAREIPRDEFIALLDIALDQPALVFR